MMDMGTWLICAESENVIHDERVNMIGLCW